MAELLIGTGGYDYPDWKGGLYLLSRCFRAKMVSSP